MIYTICMVLLVLILTGLLRSNAELKDEVDHGRTVISILIEKELKRENNKKIQLSDYTLKELAEEIGRRAKMAEREMEYDQ